MVMREECVSVFSECNWLIARTLLSLRVLLEHLPYQRDRPPIKSSKVADITVHGERFGAAVAVHVDD